jgi:hypothetical protein
VDRDPGATDPTADVIGLARVLHDVLDDADLKPTPHEAAIKSKLRWATSGHLLSARDLETDLVKLHEQPVASTESAQRSVDAEFEGRLLDAASRGILPEERAGPEEPAEGTTGEPVECTVFAPRATPADSKLLVQIFAHLPVDAEHVRTMAKSVDAEAERLNYKTLQAPIDRGDKIVFALDIPGADVDEPQGEIVWAGHADSVEFGVTIPPMPSPAALIGTVRVSRGGVPIGRMKFRLGIEAGVGEAGLQPAAYLARRYEYAFISYTSLDRDLMLIALQGIETSGLKYFADVLSIGAGDRWKLKIKAGLDRCDVFVLIWSRRAKESEYVKREVLHALERQGNDPDAPPDIHPIFVDDPIAPPWDEVSELHFNSPVRHRAVPAAADDA